MFLSRLQERERIPELMDDPLLDPDEHHRALTALSHINYISASASVLWPAIRNLAWELQRPIRVLDVATGSGDIPASLLRKARATGIELQLFGCDISPRAIERAWTNCPDGHFFHHNVVQAPLPSEFDVVCSSLFLHHLSQDDAITVLARMKQATRNLVLVNDLVRSRINFVAVWLACRLLTRSPVVHFDGPASIRSAFTRAEALGLAERAGLKGATTRHHFPCRFLLKWRRQ